MFSGVGSSGFNISWAAATDVGKLRANNEDSWLADPEAGIWVVCDGMGGHEAGEQASKLAAETIVDRVKQGANLDKAIHYGHQAVLSLANAHNQSKAPGTTVVALHIEQNNWQLGWVGDSRGWLSEKDGLRQITHDHSVVQQLIDWGVITPEEALVHPDRSRLSQVVGQPHKPPAAGLAEGVLAADDIFLLASDGMAHWHNPAVLQGILQKFSPQEAVDRFIGESLAAGGHDNITCMVIQIAMVL